MRMSGFMMERIAEMPMCVVAANDLLTKGLLVITPSVSGSATVVAPCSTS